MKTNLIRHTNGLYYAHRIVTPAKRTVVITPIATPHVTTNDQILLYSLMLLGMLAILEWVWLHP